MEKRGEDFEVRTPRLFVRVHRLLRECFEREYFRPGNRQVAHDMRRVRCRDAFDDVADEGPVRMFVRGDIAHMEDEPPSDERNGKFDRRAVLRIHDIRVPCRASKRAVKSEKAHEGGAVLPHRDDADPRYHFGHAAIRYDSDLVVPRETLRELLYVGRGFRDVGRVKGGRNDDAHSENLARIEGQSEAGKRGRMSGMRSLFVDNDRAIFNEQSAVRKRLRAYAAHMDELHVISVAPADVPAEPIRDGALTLYPVHARGLFRLSALASKARTLIREKGIDVVSAQDPFEHGLVALVASLGTPAKLHIQIHTDPFSRYFGRESAKNRVRLLIMPVVLFFADGVRVVSERVKHALAAAWYGRCAPAASVIPVALPEEDPPRAPLPPNDFMFPLIAVSRLEPEKRIEDILAAVSVVRRKYPGIGIFIAGEGSERAALERKTESLGLGNNAVFLGARADARGLMQSAKAFVQVSAYEGYGLTLLEAALAKAPIVTTDVGIVGDVLLSEEDALVVPVGDVEAIAVAIMRLIEKSDLGDRLSSHAYRRAAEHRSRYADQAAMVAGDLAATLRPPERVVPVI